MKRFAKLIAALAALLPAALSCNNPVNPEEGEITSSLILGVSLSPDEGSATKGRIEVNTDEIHDLNIFIYDYSAGYLHSSGYFTDLGSIIFDNLVEGRLYYILAVSGVGRKYAPSRLADALSFEIPLKTPDNMDDFGLPMSARELFSFGPNGDGYEASLLMERLYAKYDFILNTRALEGDIYIKSVKLHNVASIIKPWADESSAGYGCVADGDYATADEVDFLNEGSPLRLLVPENMQGDLLPDNTDPWQKVPTSIPEKKDRCTYLEVVANYEYQGISIDNLTYRLYLGVDAVSNFDIRRNTANTITLSVKDSNAVVASSWKVTRGTIDDERNIFLNWNRDTILQNSSIFNHVILEPDVYNFRLVPGEGFEEAGLSVSQPDEEGFFNIYSSTISGHDRTGRLWAVSWDGGKKCWCDITVMNWDTILTIHPARRTVLPGDTNIFKASVYYEDSNTTVDVTRQTVWSLNNDVGWFYGGSFNKDSLLFVAENIGDAEVRASYGRFRDTLISSVSTYESIGVVGVTDTIRCRFGETRLFEGYVRYANGDTLQDQSMFSFGTVPFDFAYREYLENWGLLTFNQRGTARFNIAMRVEPGYTAKYPLVVE